MCNVEREGFEAHNVSEGHAVDGEAQALLVGSKRRKQLVVARFICVRDVGQRQLVCGRLCCDNVSRWGRHRDVRHEAMRRPLFVRAGRAAGRRLEDKRRVVGVLVDSNLQRSPGIRHSMARLPTPLSTPPHTLLKVILTSK